MKMTYRCGHCGATVPNRGKFYRCSCGSEFSRAKLSNVWSVSRLACPATDATERGEVMRSLPVRACSIRCIDHPEWGTFGVMEDKGDFYEIFNRGWRVLSKDEAVGFWELIKKG